MGEMLDWWLSGGDWADLKQNRRIRELEETHSAEVAAVRSSMSRQASALDSRVDRLERALLAFVELEDTRAELNEFADAAAARRFARDLANRLLGADAPATAPAPPADLPGYWLNPAVKAVVADLYPGTADAAGLRAEARRRDDDRAELFDVLVAAVSGRESDAAGAVDRWFPRTADIDRAGRAIAAETARGRFGPEARDALVARLGTVRDEHGIEGLAELVVPDLGRLVDTAAAGARTGRHQPDPVRAATDLEGLAAIVAPADAAASAGRPALRDDPLAELLAVLINEGAPGEAPVLHRMATIRTSLAGVGVASPPAMQSSTDAAGTVWALLAAWLGDRAQPELHGLAVEVLAPVIEELAARLEAAATTSPPNTDTVSIAGSPVVVGVDGVADDSWRAAVGRAVPEPLAWARPAAGAGAAVAVLAAVLAIAVAPGWWAAAGLVAAGAVAAWVGHGRARVGAARERASAVADAQRRIDAQVEALRSQRSAATDRAAAAHQARGSISAALAATSSRAPA